MRTLLLTVGAILLAITVGASVGGPREPAEPAVWVRTVDGWQPLSDLVAPPGPPRLPHPGVVAGTQLLASLIVLLAASRD